MRSGLEVALSRNFSFREKQIAQPICQAKLNNVIA
jgi:hypothetical protein